MSREIPQSEQDKFWNEAAEGVRAIIAEEVGTGEVQREAELRIARQFVLQDQHEELANIQSSDPEGFGMMLARMMADNPGRFLGYVDMLKETAQRGGLLPNNK